MNISKEYKHSEQLEPDHKGQRRFKISYWAYENEKSKTRLRAYKIIYAEDPGNAKERANIYTPLIYDITEI